MSDSEEDVQVEIQRTLASINDVTVKIKNELMKITEILRDEGRLGTAVKDANEVLSNVVQNLGINITDDVKNGDENQDQSSNLLVPMTPYLVTEKIMSVIEGTEARSQ